MLPAWRAEYAIDWDDRVFGQYGKSKNARELEIQHCAASPPFQMRGVKQKLDNRKKSLCLQCCEKSLCRKKGPWTKYTQWRTKSPFLTAVPTCMKAAPLTALISYPTEERPSTAPHQPPCLEAEGRNTAAQLLCQTMQGRPSNRYFSPLVEEDIKVQACWALDLVLSQPRRHQQGLWQHPTLAGAQRTFLINAFPEQEGRE